MREERQRDDRLFREWIVLHLGILMENPTVEKVEATNGGWKLKVYRVGTMYRLDLHGHD